MSQVIFEIKEEEKKDDYSKFVIAPLEQGYGNTLGNSLRRVLLSSLPGAVVTSVKISGIKHQFSTLKGMREDLVEFLLNLKKVFNFFRSPAKKFLGIDIGTSAIKIVELSKEKDQVVLGNYGQMSVQPDEDKPFVVFEKSAFFLSHESVADAINDIINKAEMSTRETFFAIPDFSTFFTFIDLPLKFTKMKKLPS